MPRDSQGVYTLPAGNPVVPGTVIETDWANPTMDDIANALTASLPRDGSAPMTGTLTLVAADPTQPRHAVSKGYMEASTVLKTSDLGSAVMPTGSTEQRDVTPLQGYLRFNQTFGNFEGYDGTNWVSVGGATGGGGNEVFYENDQVATASYTLGTGKNAHSVGPVTLDAGVTITVPAGARWVVS